MTEIWQDDDGQWRFRVKGGNGVIVAWGEGYATEANAERALEDLRSIMAATAGQKPHRVPRG